MSHILDLSKVSKDLLQDDAEKHLQNNFERKHLHKVFEMREKSAKVSIMQAPQAAVKQLDHPVLLNKETLEEYVEMRRKLGGNAHAEQFIKELAGSARINRGPEGFSNSSRLHFDMLLNKDSSIDFGDYINFDKASV